MTKERVKVIPCDADCKLKLRGHWTESHKISTRCTEMIADWIAEIKIVIFQSICKRKRDEWRSSPNCGRIAAKIARFNSVNSKIIGRKFTKFGYDVAKILPFNLLKVDLRSANTLSNAEARSKIVPGNVCDHPLNLTGCHSNNPWENHPHYCAYKTCKVGQDSSRIFWDILRDMPIFAISPKKCCC